MDVSAEAAARFPTRVSGARTLLWRLSIAALLLGIIFRFTDLGVKTLWGDEAYTLLRVSGYAQADLDRLSDGRPRSVDALRFFQRVHPERSLRATADSLAVDEPQHPPLYFVAARLWMTAFGDAPSAVRSLSALAGTLALLGMFWLGSELFPRSNARWLATALVAVSPFQVVYAHDAREYSTWSAITLFATAALLTALRRGRPGWWVLYAACVAIGCYTDLIFVYVIAAHALTVLSVRSLRTPRTLASFAAALAVAAVAFAPWFLAFVQHRDVLAYDMAWAVHPMPPAMYAAKMLFNAATVFFDLGFLSTNFAVLTAAVLIVEAAALVCVARTAPPLVKAVLFPLIFTTSVAFVAADALHHTTYATASRYLVPVWIGLELAVAYACGAYVERAATTGRRRTAWRSVFVALLALGAVCDAVSLPRTIWWNNHDDVLTEPIAAAINAGPPPLLLARHDALPRLLVLSRYLRDDARIAIVSASTKPTGIANPRGLYVLDPDDRLRRAVADATGCRLVPVPVTLTSVSTADAFHAALHPSERTDGGLLWAPGGCTRSIRS